MTKILPHMTHSMLKKTNQLYKQQQLIVYGQHNIVDELVNLYARRSISAKNLKDDKYYIVTSPFLTVAIETMVFHLLVGTVLIKEQNHLVVISGCMTFKNVLNGNPSFNPLNHASFIIEDLDGKVAPLHTSSGGRD